MDIVVEVDFLEGVDDCRIITVNEVVLSLSLFDMRRRFLRVCDAVRVSARLRFCYH